MKGKMVLPSVRESLLSTFIFSWFLWWEVDARTPKDCEMVNLRSLDEPLSLTLKDTLLLSIFPSEGKWNATAQLTDSNGTKCQLVLRRNENERYEGIECPGANGVTTRKNMQVSGVWMDYYIDVEKCIGKGNLSTSQMRVTLGQQLPQGFYSPTWKGIPLHLPLTLTWQHRTQADLVFGCERAVCVQNSTTLVAPITFRRKSFFLKPGDSLRGFSLLLNPLVVESSDVVYVDLTGVPLSEGNWVQVQLENDSPFKKITVDGRLVLTLEKYKDQFQIQIQSVQLQGNGMLTWCDPRLSGDSSSAQDHIKSVVIGVLVFTVILLTGAFIYFWNKSPRVPQTSKDPAPPAKQPNSGGPTSRPRGTPPASPVSEEFIYESEPSGHLYESIRDHTYLSMRGGQQSYVSMHPPSLYDDLDGGNGNGNGSKGTKKGTKEDLHINVY